MILSKKALFLSIIFSVVVTSGVHAKSDEVHASWLSSNVAVANKHIVPRYQALSSSSQKLRKTIAKLCLPDEAVVVSRKAKKQFKRLYVDWAEIQHIKFGPISFLKRLERLQYWPDKHNSSERQVRKILFAIESGDLGVLSNIQSKSVAVQGITALERMLFSKDQLMSQSECLLANAAIVNIADIASKLDVNWRLAPVEYAKEFELADRGAGTYDSSDEVVTVLANAFATQLLIVSEYKLGRALPKKKGGRSYGRQMEAWRSELSLDLVIASLKSLRAMYKTAFKSRLKVTNKALDRRIEHQFSKILRQANNLPDSMINLIEADSGIAQIKSLKAQVEMLEAVVRDELFTELGFAIRFNSLDGD